jgi:predicted RNA-binding protein with PUA-like domain
MAKSRGFWLVKSEPDVFSFSDLLSAPGRRTVWDGVRNHQAKLFLQAMALGDGVLYYHSNAEPPGVAGIAEVVATAYPDPSQFDARSEYHEPRASPMKPVWFAVDIQATEPLPRFVSLADLKAEPQLAEMAVVQRGSRLSVTPVTAAEWRAVLRLGGRSTGSSPR